MSEFYQFQARSLQGKDIDLKEYAGKVVLVVNTASQCGLTPQYEGLQKLYERYREQGLVILGFPCNQFGKQEPGDASAISGGCLINYGVDFPMFDKIDVNGKSAHPLFNYLRNSAPGTLGNAIKWNFTKFLIGRDGKAIKRFSPTTAPEKLAGAIEAALAA